MKKVVQLLLIFSISLISFSSYAIVGPAGNSTKNTEKEMTAAEKETILKDAKQNWKSLSRKEKRAKKKELKRELRKMKKSGSSVNTTALVIIGIFIPPLAMFLYEEAITKRFWISLILSLLLLLPGIIYTLVVILE